MQSEEVSMTLKVLHQHGWSISAMGREFGLNWRTVKRSWQEALRVAMATSTLSCSSALWPSNSIHSTKVW